MMIDRETAKAMIEAMRSLAMSHNRLAAAIEVRTDMARLAPYCGDTTDGPRATETQPEPVQFNPSNAKHWLPGSW